MGFLAIPPISVYFCVEYSKVKTFKINALVDHTEDTHPSLRRTIEKSVIRTNPPAAVIPM